MTQKERLVELLKTVQTTMGGVIDMETVAKYADAIIDIEQIADHLLNNGVIVPPCKVGDTVWEIMPIEDHYYLREIVVESVYFNGRYNSYNPDWDFDTDFDDDDLGETVFMTREAAEQALKERSK